MLPQISEDWPDEGELVVCSVKSVKENGAYLDLDGYPGREGFVFIGEIATGWVRNIRAHVREGQRIVAKVIGIKKDRDSISLSIKSVSEERRRGALQSWKNEQRATQIMKVAADRIGWKEEDVSTISEEMKEAFGSLYGALEECAINEGTLEDAGFEGKWIAIVTELAIENIVPPFVEIRGQFEIKVWGPEGVEAIKLALGSAEECADGLEEVSLTCHYDGAPNYRVDIKAPDYPSAESVWEDAQKAAKKQIETVEGSITIERL
ncbi:MAG: translation initiation factor IF-2 subunit alpha [Euryarchaeota archaeon]|nr:translation initiation factor IF-2 subunit alpha [Euryarchaeota archaeon]